MTNCKIEGLTIAVTNMTAMVNFYTNVFEIDFKEMPMYNTKLYAGKWDALNLLFCPAKIANNSAKQNRHQFDIIVTDVAQVLEKVLNHGGTQMGELSKTSESISVGIYDPDNNSIVIKQLFL